MAGYGAAVAAIEGVSGRSEEQAEARVIRSVMRTVCLSLGG